MFYSIDVQTRIIQNPKINQVQSEFEIKIRGQNRVCGDFARYNKKYWWNIVVSRILKNTLINKLECIIFHQDIDLLSEDLGFNR